mgnify:CR=1 FL=1
MTTSQEYAERFDGWVPREKNERETPEQAIRDFMMAVDRGWLGQMPSGFNDSAFVKALRKHAE